MISVKKLNIPIIFILIFISSSFLINCAGSPVATSRLSSYDMMTVDDYTLCKAFTPRELYEPSYKVILEVKRRKLNCASIYQYRPTNYAAQATYMKLIAEGANCASGQSCF